MSNLKLVLWSGGCDSTLALYEALSEQKVWTVEGKQRSEVRAISIVEPVVPANPEQARARRRLAAEFKRRKLVMRAIEVQLDHTGDGPRRGKDGGAVQTQLWLGAASPYVSDDEDLVIGWHEGEFDNVDHAEAAFTALQRLNGKTGKLAFPLRKRSKISVIAKLLDLKLLDLCWWCEAPFGPNRRLATKPCGTCKKCIDHTTVLWQLTNIPREFLRKNGMLE